jgi:hypothetical protein
VVAGLVRVNVVVEGQSEETFVRDVLAPALGAREVFMYPRRVLTARRRGIHHRGGLLSFERASRDIRQWLAQEPDAFVTTMFDLYALPEDFPSWAEARQRTDVYDRVAVLEQAMTLSIGNRLFIPFIQVHEFEALLFSDVDTTDLLLSTGDPSRAEELRKVRASFDWPEHIDDGRETAPSKRLRALYPRYDKVAFGPLIAEQIGLSTLRQECRHFGEWVSRLEHLRA